MTKELEKAKKRAVAAYKHLEKAYNHMPNPCLKTECNGLNIGE